MNNNGYYGDFGSLAEEQTAYERWLEATQQPEVVPCFECGDQMYEESSDPKQNLCEKCKDLSCCNTPLDDHKRCGECGESC